MDQRGTGDSNGLLCDLDENVGETQSYFNDLFPPDRVRDCRQKLEQTSDLKLYTTPVAVGDLDEVREAMGYQKVNLYGGSYGTLASLEYLRQFGSHVRSVVFAGVSTPALKLPLNFAKGAQAAMDALIADCVANVPCHDMAPNLQKEFADLLTQFTNGPVRFEITGDTGKQDAVVMPRGVFVERLRLMLYDPRVASYVPLLIHRAAQRIRVPRSGSQDVRNPTARTRGGGCTCRSHARSPCDRSRQERSYKRPRTPSWETTGFEFMRKHALSGRRAPFRLRISNR